MDLQLILWIFLGCLAGIFTGLAPGMHVNTIAAIATAIPVENRLGTALMIAGMSIVHCFADFIPSILLGAPKEESFLAAMPGHRMLMKGKGFLAVKLAVSGALFAGIISLLFVPVFVLFVSKSEKIIEGIIPFALALVIALMILNEKSTGKKITAIAIICLSGILGVLVLRGNIVANPLFACISGFFGSAGIIEAIRKKSVLPEQEISNEKTGNKTVFQGSLLGFLAGSFVAIFPAMGNNQAAFILQKIFGKIGAKKFLVLLGASSVANVVFGFAGMLAWEKTRNGSAAAVSSLVEISMENFLLVMFACAVALGFGFLATIAIAKFFVKRMKKINYEKINWAILAVLCALVALLSNAFGIVAFVSATAIGFAAVSAKVKRTNCMAFLMIPALLFYLGF